MGAVQPAPVLQRREESGDGGRRPVFQLPIYKRGQGTAIRVVVLAALSLLWLYGCRWLYYYLPWPPAWYRPLALTGGALVVIAAVLGAGVWAYRSFVRGRSDREALRWGGLTGALVLAVVLARWLVFDLAAPRAAWMDRLLWNSEKAPPWGAVICSAVFLYGAWVIFCMVVNHPRRADFLIETETELRKVAWPARREYVGAAVVVIVMVAIVSLYLTGVDLLLSSVLRWLQIGI